MLHPLRLDRRTFHAIGNDIRLPNSQSFPRILPRFQHPLRMQRLFFTDVRYSCHWRVQRKADVASWSVARTPSPHSSIGREKLRGMSIYRRTASSGLPGKFSMRRAFVVYLVAHAHYSAECAHLYYRESEGMLYPLM